MRVLTGFEQLKTSLAEEGMGSCSRTEGVYAKVVVPSFERELLMNDVIFFCAKLVVFVSHKLTAFWKVGSSGSWFIF